MGQAKQKMIENEINNNLIDFFKELNKRDELKGSLAGISKQLVSKGISFLSEKQKYVIDSFVEEYKNNHKCERCVHDNISNLLDYIEIADQGYCTMCDYEIKKNDMD